MIKSMTTCLFCRAAMAAKIPKMMVAAPTKLNLFNLCAAVNEDMLNALFSPLGKV